MIYALESTYVGITQGELRELFHYDLENGCLIWKVARSPRIKIGTPAGYVSPYGYTQIRLNGKLWMSHRLIWMYMTGSFPLNDIDHIDGDRSNNKWGNLRDVTREENMQNRKGPDEDSLTGVLGVCFDRQSGKYRAQRTIYKRKVLNKLFNTIEEAKEAYLSFKEN